MEEGVKDINTQDELPKAGNKDWHVIKIDVNEIQLDNENPRLNINSNASKTDIIEALFEDASIDKLINSILEYNGLYPGESIILINENDKYKVIEGNRRVCSLQCILNPDLIPKEKREEIKAMIRNSEIKPDNLKTVEAVISPNRADAQQIITARHTQYQIEKWNYIQKWRRDYKAFEQTGSFDAACEYVKEDPDIVRKYLKNYSFLLYVWDMPCWTKEEREVLSKNDLEGSLLEWHMSSIQDILKIKFDKDFKLTSDLENKKFNFVVEKLIRSFYLNGYPKLNTRTDKSTFKNQLYQWMQEYNNNKNENSNNSTNPNSNNSKKSNSENGSDKTINKKTTVTKDGKKAERHPAYFKKLRVSENLSDTKLEHIVSEIEEIQVKKFPLSTLLLTRALIENSLIYRLRDKNMWDKFMEYLKKYPSKGGTIKDRTGIFTLDDTIKYCINNINYLFSDVRDATLAKKALTTLQDKNSGIRKYLNDMVHESFETPSADHVQLIADDIRMLLEKILLKEE